MAFTGASILSWAALFASLEIGRTTPMTVSRGWLVVFLGAGAALLGWLLLFGWASRRLRPATSSAPTALLFVAVAPLLPSIPFLVATYLSDELFHYLATNPIPRALVLWMPTLAVLAWQEARLVWTAPLQGRGASWLRRRHSVPLLIFAAFAALYIFTAGGHLYSPDESAMFLVTQNLADRGSVAIPNDDFAVAAGHPRFWYSKYGLVPSLLALPPHWISGLMGWEAEPPSPAFPIPNGAPPLIDLLVNPLATAGTCALLYILARRLGFRAATSLAIVLVYGLGTSAWVYSKTFFSQPTAALFLLGAVCLLMRGVRPSPRDYALAGASLGLAVGSRAELILLAAPLAIPLVSCLRRDPRAALGPLGLFAVCFLAVGGATLGGYNYAKTGSIFMTGHGAQATMAGFSSEPLKGLFGTFFSPGFGLFLYNPIALLGIVSLPLLVREAGTGGVLGDTPNPSRGCNPQGPRRSLRREAGWLFGGLLGLAVLLYGSFGDWFAGFTWANRYLGVVLPFAVLPAAALLEGRGRGPASIVLVAVAAALGTLVNLLAVLFDFNNGWLDLWQQRANLDLILWDPRFSPILAHLRLLHDFLYTGAKLDLYVYYKLGVPSLVGFLLLFTGLATLAARSALESEGEMPGRADSSPRLAPTLEHDPMGRRGYAEG